MNLTSTPKCVGIIMDGNRRWAKARGLPTLEGHRRGYEKLKDVLRWAKSLGVEHVIVFAFSTENWNRSETEVSYLLDLFKMVLTSELETLKKQGIRVRCVGALSRFSSDLQLLMAKAEKETLSLAGPTLVLALSYGGRAEIVQATQRLIDSGAKSVSEETFGKNLWTSGIADPDIIIRTGGEMRLSGFLPWQSVYSELFFTETFWPDFSEAEFKKVIEEFSERERRMGR
ncbi:MAG: polyprenyl diphosphate synthase [Patescibacteria group bacterium]